MNYKNKSFLTKKKAFTLIELLIVIAIIGILFIVLVSKVDFATDKAKATGVQTDFRSFQVAIESVAKEHAGLATFGWDTGDANGNRIRDSYDKGDANKNGVQDDGEVFVGSKTYGETWTNVYTLTNPADANDKSAIVALETAINKNLDPKLHITIHDDLTITMANGAQDPWNTEYHGYYITNAAVDNKDRGAIVMYSNGANQEFGSEHSIAGGVVTVNVPGNNVYGKDDYSIISVYTYVNGYGEVKTSTTGFSNNQGGGQAGTEGIFVPGNGGSIEDPDNNEQPTFANNIEKITNLAPGMYDSGTFKKLYEGVIDTAEPIKTWDELIANDIVVITNEENVSCLDFDGDTKDIVIPKEYEKISVHGLYGNAIAFEHGFKTVAWWGCCEIDVNEMYLPSTIDLCADQSRSAYSGGMYVTGFWINKTDAIYYAGTIDEFESKYTVGWGALNDDMEYVEYQYSLSDFQELVNSNNPIVNDIWMYSFFGGELNSGIFDYPEDSFQYKYNCIYVNVVCSNGVVQTIVNCNGMD